MSLRGLAAWLLATLLTISWQIAIAQTNYLEPPVLQARVKASKLPPIAQRLPLHPRLIDLSRENKQPGRYGGTLRLLMGKAKDIRRLVIYGYARLVTMEENFELAPDLVQSIEVKDNKTFIFHLRPGLRWSDGQPFTSEAFRYFWEDVANNKDLYPFGPPRVLKIDGEYPTVSFPDLYTVRYHWNRPNPYFLPALAGARPLFIYRPSHYLKQFHPRYTDATTLAKKVKIAGTRNWAGLHHRKDRMYKFSNPDLPTLQPWVNTTRPPSDYFIFVRNPYFHHVDINHRQLPYIDRVTISIGSPSLTPTKTGAGASDLQARYLRLDNYTFLKAAEQRNHYYVRLWRKALGAQIALLPNLSSSDPVWRQLVRDVRFRRALSLAINRHEINQVIYFGLAQESANTVLPQSPLYRPAFQQAYARFDLKRANQLLDEIGLSRRDDRGIRLLANGQPLEIILQTAGESTEETDVLELVTDSWLQLGIKLLIKPSQRQVFRERVFSGSAMMSVWSGLDNALPNADTSPEELAPTAQNQLQWPKWGQYYETGGKAGEAVDLPAAARLLTLNQQWRQATDFAQRRKIWLQMLAIYADQVFTIGIVRGVPQPVVVNADLRNVPVEGLFSWAPGAYFGLYKPDTFWFDRPPAAITKNTTGGD